MLALKQELADCAVVLVVIGPRWLGVTDAKGRRRLDSPDDWVRQEIAVSLQRPEVRVLPILLDTTMPDAESLPADLRPLVRWQALPLTSRHWSSDIARLVEVLRSQPGMNAAPLEAPRATHWLSRPSVKRAGLLGAALIILAAVGLVAFRPSLIGMRQVVISGPTPLYAPYKTGDVFQECAECPEMIVIVPEVVETGSGMRGLSASTLKPYAIGKYEVTRAQFFAAGVAAGQGCWDHASDRETMRLRSSKAPGFGQTDDHPVVCVNLREIRTYFAWLNSRSGAERTYRLPSEDEWFYAAMAGTGDVEPWGTDRAQACEYGNLHDVSAATGKPETRATYECTDGYAFSAPVGRFQANSWGLHDTMGNVAEWLQDCGRGGDDCSVHVVAGGHYDETLQDARRFRFEGSDDRRNYTGFRVARFL